MGGAALARAAGGRPRLRRFWERWASLDKAQGGGDPARHVRRGHGAVDGVTVGIRDRRPNGSSELRAAYAAVKAIQSHNQCKATGGRGADRLVEEAP